MKYKEIYTTEEYMEMLCEVSYIEPPNCMIYLIDSLNRLNKILAISNKSEFGKILLAKNRLEANPDMTTKLIYDSVKTEYKNKILQFLDGLALHSHHLENGILVKNSVFVTSDGREALVINSKNIIHEINIPTLIEFGVLNDPDLFSFILCYISQFRRYHHYDIFGKKR